jgi:hypothetical protein
MFKKVLIVVSALLIFSLTYIGIKAVKFFYYIPFLFGSFSAVSQPLASPVIPDEKPIYSLCNNVIGVCEPSTKVSSNYVFDKQLYDFRCDTIPQVRFWRQIMGLHQDSVLVNLGHNRTVVHKLHVKDWSGKNDPTKQRYRDSIRLAHNLDSNHRILVTSGKQFFYDFDKAFTNFDRGINAFVSNGVDPWYAQAILLIESPNKLQKSNAGAYGPFQLMKDVARLFGLRVNRQVDERADFDRAAYAASSLIKKVCIPKTKEILDTLHIPYNESELWFKLLVMHSYHAGAGNVKKALENMSITSGDMSLIFTLWHTETRHFRSASQNYSQLVLAAMLEMNARLKVSADLSPETSSINNLNRNSN